MAMFNSYVKLPEGSWVPIIPSINLVTPWLRCHLRVSPAGQQQIHQGKAFAQRQMLQHLAAVEPGLERSVEGGAVGKMGNGGWKHRENIGKTHG